MPREWNYFGSLSKNNKEDALEVFHKNNNMLIKILT